MATQRTQRSFAAVLSVLGHAALVALLTFSVPLATPQRGGIEDAAPISTVMIDQDALLAEMARIEAAELADTRAREEAAQKAREEAAAEQRHQDEIEQKRAEAERQAELDRQQRARELVEAAKAAEADQVRLAARLEEERKQREAAEREQQLAEEKRKQQEEQRRQEELARQQEEERLRAVEEEARRQQQALERQRQEIANQIAAAAAAEEADRRAREAGLLDLWIRQIESKVTSKWIRPLNAGSDLDCLLDVDLLPDGTVQRVKVNQCSNADQNVVRSLENAVTNASPFPRRPDGLVYEKSIRIRFKPTD